MGRLTEHFSKIKKSGRTGSGKYGGISIDISMLGDVELQKQFDKLQGMGRTNMMSQAAKTAMMPVMEDVKANAPKDTGALSKAMGRRSVKAMRGRRARGLVGARVLLPERSRLNIPPDAKGYYPAHVELGTKKMTARKFLRTALYSNQGRVFSILRRELYARIRLAMMKKGMNIPESVDRGAAGE